MGRTFVSVQSKFMLSHTILFCGTSTNNLSSFDCSLHGACLAEDSLSEVPPIDSAAAGEDKKKKAPSRPLSLLVTPEHSDVETHAF